MSAIPGILEKLEKYTGASPGSVVLVPNATTGVNTILSNLRLNPGDELVTTGQEYFASLNALRFYADRNGAKVIEVPIDIPVSGPDQVIDSIMSRVTDRTVLVLIDHISSATGMIFPVEELVQKLDRLGIDVLVDGAHGPGMLDSMDAVILPYRVPSGLPHPEGIDPLWTWLLKEKHIEIPVTHTAIPPGRFLRFSAQLYNGDAEFEYLADALRDSPDL